MERFQQTESVEREILGLERQGLRLSGASLVVLLALAAVAMVALVPAAAPASAGWLARGSLVWNALGAFALLAPVLGLYSFWRQRMLSRARGDLVRELVRQDAMEKLTLLDPLTETFNRRHLEELIRREADRVERHGTSLTFLRIEVENLAELTTRSGGEVGERLLKDVAQLLKNSLRPTDVVVRYDTSEFLIVMSETSKHGALVAVRRLLERADELNRANECVAGYPIRCGSVTVWPTTGRGSMCVTCWRPQATASSCTESRARSLLPKKASPRFTTGSDRNIVEGCRGAYASTRPLCGSRTVLDSPEAPGPDR